MFKKKKIDLCNETGLLHAHYKSISSFSISGASRAFAATCSLPEPENICGKFVQMVYFWTYAHPSYCPSDLLARGFTAARWTSGRSARSPSLF